MSRYGWGLLVVALGVLAAALCVSAAVADWSISDPGSSWQYEAFGAFAASVVTSLLWGTIVLRVVQRLVKQIEFAAKVRGQK